MSLRFLVDKLLKVEKEKFRKPKMIVTFTLDGIIDSDDLIVVYIDIGI